MTQKRSTAADRHRPIQVGPLDARPGDQAGQEPDYWQKGKPYLNSVTWTTVPQDATRELQLKGGQAQIDEFPAYSSIQELQNTPGVVMHLFPSTRTDYMPMNEKVKPFDDVHVRRAISYALDRQAIIDSVLFGNGKPANSFMPPQVPYYDPNSPGIQYDMDKAKEELAQSSVPDGLLVRADGRLSGVDQDEQIAQILQNSLKQLNINVKLRKVDPSVEFAAAAEGRLRDDVGLLDDGHRRPRRAGARSRSTADDSRLVLHLLQQPAGDRLDAPGAVHVRQGRAPDAVLEHPETGGRGRLHGVRVLLAVPLRDIGQGAGFPGLPDRATTTWRTSG